MSAVEFIGVSKTYGTEIALRDFSLHIPEGSLTSLLGPSGCGKTTALRLVAGFLSPTEGQILVDGVDITPVAAAKRGFGMVFQSYSLFPHLSAGENIAYGLKLKRLSKSQIRNRVNQLLELTQLEGQRDKFPHQLSGGQQQRVALARALATEPRLLLLDEPLSALDAAVREQLRTEIRELQQQSGVTTLFVTHDQQEALALSDQVAVMSKGALEQVGRPEEIYGNPASQFVAEFVGTSNQIPVTHLGGGQWRGLGLDFQGPIQGVHGTAYVRPEELQLTRGSGFRVHTKTYQGSQTRLELANVGQAILIDIPSALASNYEVGSQVDISSTRQNPLIVLSAK